MVLRKRPIDVLFYSTFLTWSGGRQPGTKAFSHCSGQRHVDWDGA